ncbi:hypothetical protein GIB67_029010, partial [Kingdonia uniflora]
PYQSRKRAYSWYCFSYPSWCTNSIKGEKISCGSQPVEPTELVQYLISTLIGQGSSSTSSNDNTSSKVMRVLKDMVSSYEIDNALFFKSLKFLE